MDKKKKSKKKMMVFLLCYTFSDDKIDNRQILMLFSKILIKNLSRFLLPKIQAALKIHKKSSGRWWTDARVSRIYACAGIRNTATI